MARYANSKAFAKAIETASVEAIHEAAAWLMQAMQQLVSVQCGVSGPLRHTQKDGRHSAPGEPPRMESGDGLASIGMERTKRGALVGVESMGIPNMTGGNYMAGWDSPNGIRGVRRPWLQHFYTDPRYQRVMGTIITSYMKLKTGAT